jgi:hypothetical protein
MILKENKNITLLDYMIVFFLIHIFIIHITFSLGIHDMIFHKLNLLKLK